MMQRSSSFLVLTLVAAVAACDPTSPDESFDGVSSADALSSSFPIGTELVTTSKANFREGPSLDDSVIRLLPAGTTLKVVNRTTPSNGFYDVSVGGSEGWVSGTLLAPVPTSTGGACTQRKLTFSADDLVAVPSGAAWVWGGNATGGELYLDPPYAPDFMARAKTAHARGQQVFAYLEGPCGDTGGVDDGERARCANIHGTFNAHYAPGTPNTAKARWKPFTMKQLTTSGTVGADYCEIDNLDNNVTIPLNPLLKEIKGMYDAGQVHCRIVLKNVDASGIDSIRANVAATPADANFIAPFAIYEADDTGEKSSLDAAMRRLKGAGAVSIVSLDTNHYGSAFTHDTFTTCP